MVRHCLQVDGPMSGSLNRRGHPGASDPGSVKVLTLALDDRHQACTRAEASSSGHGPARRRRRERHGGPAARPEHGVREHEPAATGRVHAAALPRVVDHVRVTRAFLNDPAAMLRKVLHDEADDRQQN